MGCGRVKGLGCEISLFSFLEFTCPIVLRHTHAHTHTHIQARAALVYRKLREGGLSGSWQGPLSAHLNHTGILHPARQAVIKIYGALTMF